MDAWADVAREGIAAGVTSPRLVTERAIAQLERLLALDPEDVPAIAAGRRRPGRGDRIADVVRDVVNPAFARYGETLQAYLPHCTETIGLSALPDGDGIYAALILAWTTLPLDPREVHELGLGALRRHPGGARAIADRLGYANAADGDRGASGERREHRRSPRRRCSTLARAQVERS